MQNSKNISSVRSIAVLLFENFSNHCLANAIEPFRAANTIARQNLYDWMYLSMDGGRVTSSSGLPVETGPWHASQASGDTLLVMPSYGFSAFTAPRVLNAVRAARSRFKTLAGLDTGAWLLAAAGLLENRKATIHWDEFTHFAETFPDVRVVEDRFVLGDDIATCGGVSTTLELMLELIKRHHGPMFALEVAAFFMYGDNLDLHDPYARLTAGSLVQRAAALMRRTIEHPLTIPDLSKQLKTDQKSLEVAFQSVLKTSPQKVYKTVRLREARRLTELTRLSVTEIADRCGYQNASAMTRAYRSLYGFSPTEHRRLAKAEGK